MKVNRDSWHYKWLAYTTVMQRGMSDSWVADQVSDGELTYRQAMEKYLQNDIPTNFCQYWRRVLFTGPAIPLINFSLMLMVIGSFVLFTKISFIVIGAFVGAAALIFLFFIIGALFTIGTEKIYERINNTNNFSANVYKSYKNNVCTLMEYKDE